jgi:hypothetical protein
MKFILNKLEKDIESHMMEFLDSISCEFKLDIRQIKLSWEKFCSKEKISESDCKNSNEVINIEINTESDTAVSEIPIEPKPEPVSLINSCSYVFIKGKNEGSRCSNVVKNDSKYCTKHLKFENSDKKDKKIIPKLVDNKRLVLMVLQGTPYWWNQETSLVFVSSDNKTVIAKYSNGVLNKLTSSDINECDKYKFVYDANYDFNFLKSSEDQKPTILEDDTNAKSLTKKSLTKAKESPLKEEKNEVKLQPIKKNIMSDEEKQKKLEIYKTNVCAKNIEDVLSNILNNSDDDYEDDDYDEEVVEENELIDEEENELVDEEEPEPDDEEDNDNDFNEEDEYLDEEM